MGANPVEMEWDGDSNKGDGCGWGQVLVSVQLSNTVIHTYRR